MNLPRRFPAKTRNALIAGLVLLLLAAGAVYRYRSQSAAPVPSAAVTGLSAEQYRTEARSAAKVLAEGAPAASAEAVTAERQRLLAMRVPKEYKDLHIQLVLAADAIAGGQRGRADALLAALRQAYPWISD